MLKPIQSNISPGHSHNGHSSVVGLSVDSCPGIILKRNNKVKLTKDQIEARNWTLEDDDLYCNECDAKLNPKTAIPLCCVGNQGWFYFGTDCAKRALKERPDFYFTRDQAK